MGNKCNWTLSEKKRDENGPRWVYQGKGLFREFLADNSSILKLISRLLSQSWLIDRNLSVWFYFRYLVGQKLVNYEHGKRPAKAATKPKDDAEWIELTRNYS